MPPPLAPWLYPHHDDVLKGIQAFSSIREARNAADRLRMMRDQMDALATYRKGLIDQKAQQFRDAMTKFEDRNALLKQQNTIREKAADAVQSLRDTRENERLDRLYQPKTTVGAHHAVTVYPGGGMDVTPLDEPTTTGGSPKLVVEDVPGSKNLAVGYNANNPKAGFHFFDKRTGETRQPSASQMLTAGAELSKSIDDNLSSIGKELIKQGAAAAGITNTPPPAVNTTPIKAPSLWESIKQRIAGSPPPLTVNPGASFPASGATPMAAPAVPAFEPAPLDVKQRVKGKTYMGKGGPGVWTGTGWAVPGPAAPAAAPVAPITTADLPVQLQDVPRDGLMGLPTFEPTGTDDIDELLKQLDMGDEEAE